MQVLHFLLFFDAKIHFLRCINIAVEQFTIRQTSVETQCATSQLWASLLNLSELELLVYKIELITFTSQEICVSFE